MTRLALHLQRMPNRPPSAAEILSALIETADIEVSLDGRVVITFAPDAETLDALMVFDAGARDREGELIQDGEGEFYGSGCRQARA